MPDKTLADRYCETMPRVDVPIGCAVVVQVAVFDDDSIHVGSPGDTFGGEDAMVAALSEGIRALGYRCELSRPAPSDIGAGFTATVAEA